MTEAPLVLILDGTATSRAMLADAVRMLGYRVSAPDTLADPHRRVLKERPAALLLDVDTELGGEGAIALCQKMRLVPELHAIPVAAITSRHADPEARALLVNRYGVRAYLKRPIKIEEIRSFLVEHLGLRHEALATHAIPRAGEIGRDAAFAEILLACFLEGKDGIITVSRDQLQKRIAISSGVPASVDSNQRSENFGNFLIDRGLLTHEAYSEVTAAMVRDRGQFGATAVKLGLIPQDRLPQLLEEHTIHKCQGVFLWVGGRYAVDIGEAHTPSNPSALYCLLVSGVRRACARRDTMGEWLSRPDAIVTPSPALEAHLPALRAGGLLPSLAAALALGPVVVGAIYSRLRHEGAALLSDLTLLRELRLVSVPGHEARIVRLEGTRSSSAAIDPAMQERIAALLERSQQIDDYYQLLGVAVDASPSVIESQVKAFNLKYDPSGLVGALPPGSLHDHILQIAAAVDDAAVTLVDPVLRQEYDMRRPHQAVADISDAHSGGTGLLRLDPVQRAVKAEISFKDGESALLQGDTESATTHFTEAVEMNGGEPEYWAFLGWSFYCRDGSSERAEQCLRRAMKRDSQLPCACYLLSHFLIATGRKEEGSALLERFYQDPQADRIDERLRPFRLRARARTTSIFSRLWPFSR